MFYAKFQVSQRKYRSLKYRIYTLVDNNMMCLGCVWNTGKNICLNLYSCNILSIFYQGKAHVSMKRNHQIISIIFRFNSDFHLFKSPLLENVESSDYTYIHTRDKNPQIWSLFQTVNFQTIITDNLSKDLFRTRLFRHMRSSKQHRRKKRLNI